MKTIDTLIEDIYGLLGKDNVFDVVHTEEFGRNLASIIAGRVRSDPTPNLRMSNLGSPCDRKLWYSINTPEAGEELKSNVRMKFLFGDILEALLIFLAKQAGHTVTNEQQEVEISGVKGHIDCIIDGHLVDVKSASSISFGKFRDGSIKSNDPFGYCIQLSSYLYACQHLSELRDKASASFFAVDKQLGYICLSTQDLSSAIRSIPRLVDAKRKTLSGSIPVRAYKPEPHGKSGNLKIPTTCEYCAFKHPCWPNLRTFLYSDGPKYLTTTTHLPKVPEL